MRFKCERCGIVFDRQYVYENHLKRKTPCIPVIEPDPDAEFSCIHCGRSFRRKYALTRHYTTCKMVKSKLSLTRRINTAVQTLENVSDTSVKNTGSLNIEGTSNIVGDHNNQTIINNYYINVPQVTIYDREHIKELILEIINDERMQEQLDILKIQISGSIRKNKLGEIIGPVLRFIHDNVLFPKGKNIFLGKGDLNDSFITRQSDGWARTRIMRILTTTLFELITMLKITDFDPTHPNTKKCMDILNDSKNFNADFGTYIRDLISKFQSSKINPPIDKLSPITAEIEKTSIILSPEAKKIYDLPRDTTRYAFEEESEESEKYGCIKNHRGDDDELMFNSSEDNEYKATRERRLLDGRDSEDDSACYSAETSYSDEDST